ncbi:unnamed protein product, partial [Rotaria magnacalcarata]
MEYAPLVNEDDEANECLSSDEIELKPQNILKINHESKLRTNLKPKMGISCSSILSICRNKAHKTQPRNIMISRRDLNSIWYPKNVIRNQKYNILT